MPHSQRTEIWERCGVPNVRQSPEMLSLGKFIESLVEAFLEKL